MRARTHTHSLTRAHTHTHTNTHVHTHTNTHVHTHTRTHAHTRARSLRQRYRRDVEKLDRARVKQRRFHVCSRHFYVVLRCSVVLCSHDLHRRGLSWRVRHPTPMVLPTLSKVLVWVRCVRCGQGRARASPACFDWQHVRASASRRGCWRLTCEPSQGLW
jgi:hypothetical protein